MDAVCAARQTRMGRGDFHAGQASIHYSQDLQTPWLFGTARNARYSGASEAAGWLALNPDYDLYFEHGGWSGGMSAVALFR